MRVQVHIVTACVISLRFGFLGDLRGVRGGRRGGAFVVAVSPLGEG